MLYLSIINIIGFILYLINMFLYSHTEDKEVDKLLTITSLLGGSLGIILSILIFDRQAFKENMMSRVFVVCVFVIQLVIFLFFRGVWGETISFGVYDFFVEHQIFIAYLIIINIATFIAFAIDKHNAIKRKMRIRIVTLLILAFLGGSIGGIIAMYLFRHKTKKDYFSIGMPMILVTQIIALFCLINL